MSRASETRHIAGHAFAVLIGLWAVVSLGLVDTWVASRHSPEALAALAVGASVHLSVIVGCMGVIQAQLPLWAELHGAKAGATVGRTLRQAIFLLLALLVLASLGLAFPGPILRWTQVPAELEGMVREYLLILILAQPGLLFFRLFATLNFGVSRPKLTSALQVLGLLLKIPLSLVLVSGWGPIPALGLAGCAWATVVVATTQSLVAIVLLRRDPLYRPYRVWDRFEKPNWPILRRMLGLGLPAGFTVLVEVTSFTLMALFIARLGVAATGAHQVVASLASQLFMPALALAIAGSARVSYWLGAQDPRQARAALRAALRLCCVVMCVQALVVGVAREQIAGFFIENAATAALTSGLLICLVFFHLADALQVVGMFVLRCFGVVLAPLVAYVVMGWGVGLGGGYWLAYVGLGPLPALQSPIAFWIAATLALAVLSAVLLGLLWRAVRLHRQGRGASDWLAR